MLFRSVAPVSRLIEALEDHDDVKEVYSNADFPEGTAGAVWWQAERILNHR